MASIKFTIMHGCIIFVQSDGPIDATEFDSYVAFLDEVASTVRPNRSLAIAESDGPTASQRRALADVIKRKHPGTRAAVVTNSSIARGVVTALSWFSPIYRAYPQSQLSTALAWLGVGNHDEIRAQVNAFRSELGLGPLPRDQGAAT